MNKEGLGHTHACILLPQAPSHPGWHIGYTPHKMLLVLKNKIKKKYIFFPDCFNTFPLISFLPPCFLRHPIPRIFVQAPASVKTEEPRDANSQVT